MREHKSRRIQGGLVSSKISGVGKAFGVLVRCLLLQKKGRGVLTKHALDLKKALIKNVGSKTSISMYIFKTKYLKKWVVLYKLAEIKKKVLMRFR